MNSPVIQRLNDMSEATLRATLAHCCGSTWWVSELLRQRPFASVEALRAAAGAATAAMSAADWREALLAAREHELPHADESTRAAADVALRLYRERFGFSFITDAENLTADELLMLIRIRLGHDESAELRRSRVEHERLTMQRLERLLQVQSAT